MKAWLVMIAALATQAATAGVPEGRTAWAAGDYARAVAEYRPAAEAGDAEAQFGLGEAYRLGRGVDADPAAAIAWYRRAADQGHGRASDALGLTLFTVGQRQQAMPFLEKGIVRGDPRVLYVLGTARFNGDVVAKDRALGYALMRRAAATGLPQAKTSAGVMERYLFPAEKAKAEALIAAQTRAEPARRPPASATRSPETRPATDVRPAAPKPLPTSTPTPALSRPIPDTVAAKPSSASSKPVARGEWRVQLGAYGSAERARTAWKDFAAKVPPLASVDQRIVDGGKVQRLQAAGVADRAAATALCKALAKAGSDGCFVIAP